MNKQKKQMTIAGTLAAPVVVGKPAYIQELSGMRRTSTVVQVQKTSPSELRIETVNPRYLHL